MSSALRVCALLLRMHDFHAPDRLWRTGPRHDRYVAHVKKVLKSVVTKSATRGDVHQYENPMRRCLSRSQRSDGG